MSQLSQILIFVFVLLVFVICSICLLILLTMFVRDSSCQYCFDSFVLFVLLRLTVLLTFYSCHCPLLVHNVRLITPHLHVHGFTLAYLHIIHAWPVGAWTSWAVSVFTLCGRLQNAAVSRTGARERNFVLNNYALTA